MAIYMPVSPLAVAAMLACARIGAVHTVVFAGFSAESLAGRINDGERVEGREKPGGPWPLFLGAWPSGTWEWRQTLIKITQTNDRYHQGQGHG